MGNEITSVQQYNNVGAALLPKYGKDDNNDHEIDLNEAAGSLTIDEFGGIANAGNDDPSTISYLDVLTYEGYKISQAVLDQVRSNAITVPEMIDISKQVRIMKREVTVGLFRQVMEGYKITGHNADQLRATLADLAEAGNALTCINLLDGREFAKRLSEQTGRKFRVPTEAEWGAAQKLVDDQRAYEWTETLFDSSSYVLRSLDSNARLIIPPEYRHHFAFRLVEDK